MSKDLGLGEVNWIELSLDRESKLVLMSFELLRILNEVDQIDDLAVFCPHKQKSGGGRALAQASILSAKAWGWRSSSRTRRSIPIYLASISYTGTIFEPHWKNSMRLSGEWLNSFGSAPRPFFDKSFQMKFWVYISSTFLLLFEHVMLSRPSKILSRISWPVRY